MTYSGVIPIFYCRKCNHDIKVPDFTRQEKDDILRVVANGLLLEAIKWVKDNKGLSLKDSKACMLHLNRVKNNCNRCNNTNLEGENVICPKCKALNLNW